MEHASRHSTEPCGSEPHLCGYLLPNYQGAYDSSWSRERTWDYKLRNGVGVTSRGTSLATPRVRHPSNDHLRSVLVWFGRLKTAMNGHIQIAALDGLYATTVYRHKSTLIRIQDVTTLPNLALHFLCLCFGLDISAMAVPIDLSSHHRPFLPHRWLHQRLV